MPSLAQLDSRACFRLSHRPDGWIFCAGVLDLKQAQEWVVTTKLGASDKRPGTQVCTALQNLGKVPYLALSSIALSCCDSLCSGRGQCRTLVPTAPGCKLELSQPHAGRAAIPTGTVEQRNQILNAMLQGPRLLIYTLMHPCACAAATGPRKGMPLLHG
jgi:hypothetical protein